MLPANPPTARTNDGAVASDVRGVAGREVDPDPAEDDRLDHRPVPAVIGDA